MYNLSKFIFLLLITGSFFINYSAYSQDNPKIDKKTFFVDIEDIESANKYLKLAEKYYKKGVGTYDESLKYYLKLYNYNKESHALNYKIGVCYLFSSNKSESLKYFENSSPEVAKDYYLLLGRSYQYNRTYLKAIESYNNYIDSLKEWQKRENQKQIDQFISECRYSMQITKDSASVFIINLGPIVNTYYDEHSAFLPPKDSNIYFTTRRPDKEPRKRVSRFKFKERIYLTNNCLRSPSKWVSNLKALNRKSNVSMAGVDKYDQRIFFYEGKRQNGRLLMTSYNPNKHQWSFIKPIRGRINHIAYRETSISVGPDNTAYFISDRRGSEGGKDIWVSDYKRNNRWGKPYNIGNGLNTSFDEEGIYISDDGATLYFSSNGHLGMGGYDIYKSSRQIDGSWSDPQNMGHPINSPADELFYHPTRDPMIALYSTTRADGYGGLDIYKIVDDPRMPFSLIGSVTDLETGDVLAASISIYNLKTQKSLQATQVDTLAGIYMSGFEDVGDFGIQINMEGYKTIVDTIECPKEKHATIVMDYELEELKHPFTLAGYITDVDNNTSLTANIEFIDTVTKIVYGRQFTDSSGYYTITFEDKFDMGINIVCEDYFPFSDYIQATTELADNIVKNISLKRSKIEYNLTGVVTDETNTIAVFAAISFYRPGDTDPFNIIFTDSTNGKYHAVLEDAGPFLIEIEANGYFFLNETYQFSNGQTFTAKNFNLKKMETGAIIVVENILFNSGKSSLKASSFSGLDKLANLLIKNDKIRVEVSGHTDNVGSATVNKRISKARALTVKNYLVSRGVESERFEYVGYGFDKPIAPNDTEEGRSTNRRVEIKVLE